MSVSSDADPISLLSRLRVASGVDVHPFADGRPLVLAGVTIPGERGLAGHSDADVIAHSVTDALLGSVGLDDIGEFFPEDSVAEGANSMELLATVVGELRTRECTIINVDVVVIAQQPRLAPHRNALRDSLAATLGCDASRVTVRATTTDHLGFIGRAEGIAAMATALVAHDG